KLTGSAQSEIRRRAIGAIFSVADGLPADLHPLRELSLRQSRFGPYLAKLLQPLILECYKHSALLSMMIGADDYTCTRVILEPSVKRDSLWNNYFQHPKPIAHSSRPRTFRAWVNHSVKPTITARTHDSSRSDPMVAASSSKRLKCFIRNIVGANNTVPSRRRSLVSRVCFGVLFASSRIVRKKPFPK